MEIGTEEDGRERKTQVTKMKNLKAKW